MAGIPRLIRWLLAALVLGAHAVGLDWFARQLGTETVLRTMAPAMYTRLLKPELPPEVVVAAVPAPVVKTPAPRRTTARALPARPAASQPVQEPALPEPVPAGQGPGQTGEASVPPLEEPTSDAAAANTPAEPPVAAPPPLPAVAAVPPLPAASAAAPLTGWPGDTRLTYRLGGKFRSGDLYGDARVQWQRDGSSYQVRIDVDVTLFATLVMTSQGEVTAAGLMPRAYEEVRPGNRRRSAQFGPEVLALENGKSAARPAGMQDTASQFVELAHRFATGQEVLEVGRSISVWLARPGAVDRWTYDVVEREILQTPQLGAVEAFRLKPRPLANPRGNITAEMWFAPSLQYLPVRIKVLMGDNTYVDLMVDQIEQR